MYLTDVVVNVLGSVSVCRLVQFWNMPAIKVACDVSSQDRLGLFNFVQPANMLAMFDTFAVLESTGVVNFEQPSNIDAMLVAFDVSKVPVSS